MVDQTKDKSFDETLFKHCSAKDSGTAFITTKKNRSCQIIINKGDIRAISIGKQLGFSAAIKLRSEGIKAFSFKEDFIVPFKDEAIVDSSDEVLEFLGFTKSSSIPESSESEVVEPISELFAPIKVEEKPKTVKMYRGNIIED